MAGFVIKVVRDSKNDLSLEPRFSTEIVVILRKAAE